MTAIPINLCVLTMLAVASVGAISIGDSRLSLVVILAFSCQGVVVTHQIAQMMYKDVQRMRDNHTTDNTANRETEIDNAISVADADTAPVVPEPDTETDSMLSTGRDNKDIRITDKISGYENI